MGPLRNHEGVLGAQGVSARKACFAKANLREAILRDSDLRNAILPEVKAPLAEFSGCDLRETVWVEADLSALKAPIMTVVAERNGGRDGASDAQTAAAERGASIDVVALGSVEGEALALDALRRGAASGSWVLLENAHLASKRFVAGLEKRIRECGVDALPGFRVVLTVEATPGIEALPRRLFAASRVITLPSDAGLRASLLRHDALAAENPAPPRERGRVRALFALAHAVVTERARYDDGWSKAYEWGDVDAVCALRSCDAVLDACTQAHVAPAALPWASLRDAFESTYGARLERESDRRALKALADLLVSREAFEMADTAPLPCGAVLGRCYK